MKIEALVSFCGALSMAKGEVRDCGDMAVVSDLLDAGYVREVEESAEPTENKPKSTTRKAVKPGESK